MPLASRKEDKCVHAGWSPSPFDITEGASKVYIESKLAARVDDATTVHTKGDSTHNKSGGSNVKPKISSGSSNVFIEGKAAARIGDSVDCGATVNTGCAKVYIGG